MSWVRCRITEEGDRLVHLLFGTGGRVNSEGMEAGMKTGNMHGCLWIQQHCNTEVQRWRHGHCGWRTGGGGGGSGGGGGGGSAQSGFLSWHTLHCPFPACLLKNAQLHPPPSAKKPCSVNPDSAWDSQSGRTFHSFDPLTFPDRLFQVTLKAKLQFITTSYFCSSGYQLWKK